MDYWNGPRKKNKEGRRFDPTSPGLFLGYAIHPEFSWRNEFMIVPTQDLVENEANGAASVWKVLKVVKPDDTNLPCREDPHSARMNQDLMKLWGTMSRLWRTKMQSLGKG